MHHDWKLVKVYDTNFLNSWLRISSFIHYRIYYKKNKVTKKKKVNLKEYIFLFGIDIWSRPPGYPGGGGGGGRKYHSY